VKNRNKVINSKKKLDRDLKKIKQIILELIDKKQERKLMEFLKILIVNMIGIYNSTTLQEYRLLVLIFQDLALLSPHKRNLQSVINLNQNLEQQQS